MKIHKPDDHPRDCAIVMLFLDSLFDWIPGHASDGKWCHKFMSRPFHSVLYWTELPRSLEELDLLSKTSTDE